MDSSSVRIGKVLMDWMDSAKSAKIEREGIV